MNTQDELKIRDMEILFQPFHSRKLDTPTRIVLPAMTRGFSPGGAPTDEVAAYYQRRAKHEVGLIITEGTFIDEPSASPSSNYPNFFGGAPLRGWKKVLEAVHTTDCKIAPQLWHVGMARPFKGENLPNPELPPIGPSGIDVNTLRQTTDPMSAAKIEEVIDAFARAAADAKRLGFDGVEIHGAHGYLIDQFFWKETNRRTDEYGGDLVGRTRFASRIIHAVRKAVGSQFPIIFRFSQWKTGHYDAKLARTPVELEDFLTPLTEAGVDIFDCSTRRFWEPEFEGSRLNLAGWTKKLTGKPAISVGSVGLNREFTNVFDGGPEAETASIRFRNVPGHFMGPCRRRQRTLRGRIQALHAPVPLQAIDGSFSEDVVAEKPFGRLVTAVKSGGSPCRLPFPPNVIDGPCGGFPRFHADKQFMIIQPFDA